MIAEKILNQTLHIAKFAKKDEFYTQLSDIESELKHYEKHFKNKVVFCNCDDPRNSNFFNYFAYNFEKLGLKKLITTCYKNQETDLFFQEKNEKAVFLEYIGDKNGNKIPDAEEIGLTPLKGDGDFRSKESIDLLKQADIVVTNPPFSLFREYIAQLVKYKKKFLIIGNIKRVFGNFIWHSLRYSLQHDGDVGQNKPCDRRFDGVLVILGQPSEKICPGDTSFHHPAEGDRDKPVGRFGTARPLKNDPGRFSLFGELAQIGAVAQDFLQTVHPPCPPRQKGAPFPSVVRVGRPDTGGPQTSARVNQQVSFPSVDLLVRVSAPLFKNQGREFNALAVNAKQ